MAQRSIEEQRCYREMHLLDGSTYRALLWAEIGYRRCGYRSGDGTSKQDLSLIPHPSLDSRKAQYWAPRSLLESVWTRVKGFYGVPKAA